MPDMMIPTAGGNSRLAALQARRRPGVDISKSGQAIVYGDGAPLLTNDVDAISDRALGGVFQRGFTGGREAVRTAMDAQGRTYRTNLLSEAAEPLMEAKAVENAMAEEDAVAKQRAANAVGALKARGESDVYFSPEAGAMRRVDQSNKIALANAQQQGALARANADVYGADADVQAARINAAAQEAEARVAGGARSLAALADLRAGLRPAVPEKRRTFLNSLSMGMLGTPAQPGSDPDAAVRQNYDAQIAQILSGLRNPPGTPAAPGQSAAPGAAPVESPDTQRRALQVATFAQQWELNPAEAEAILIRTGVLQPQ